MEEIGEDNQTVGKISQTIKQMPTQGLEHDKIRAQWASSILSKNMLMKVWWCKHSEMESWRWTIYCPMSCSKGGKHAHAKGGKKSHATLRCCWKKEGVVIDLC